MSPPGGRANGRILIGLALAIFAVALALAARPHDETNAERIDRITSELRCPVCQGLSVKDSPSQTAREMRALPKKTSFAAPLLLRALFERVRFATQKCESFAGEMEGTRDQDSVRSLVRGIDGISNGWTDGVGE